MGGFSGLPIHWPAISYLNPVKPALVPTVAEEVSRPIVNFSR